MQVAKSSRLLDALFEPRCPLYKWKEAVMETMHHDEQRVEPGVGTLRWTGPLLVVGSTFILESSEIVRPEALFLGLRIKQGHL